MITIEEEDFDEAKLCHVRELGSLYIPKKIRTKLNIKPHDLVEVVEKGGVVLIRKG